jgi:uncharacterized protein YkwD
MKYYLLFPTLLCFTFLAIFTFSAKIDAQSINVKHLSSKTENSGSLVGASTLERQVFELINRKRAENGLQPLVWSERAAQVARLHSRNMASLNFFSHTGADGKRVDDRADSVGLSDWRAIGENIAFNRGFGNPIERVVESWMQSRGHRENLLDSRWRESGVGISVTDSGTYYFTQVFVKR